MRGEMTPLHRMRARVRVGHTPTHRSVEDARRVIFTHLTATSLIVFAISRTVAVSVHQSGFPRVGYPIAVPINAVRVVLQVLLHAQFIQSPEVADRAAEFSCESNLSSRHLYCITFLRGFTFVTKSFTTQPLLLSPALAPTAHPNFHVSPRT